MNWPNFAYRVALAVIAVASIAFGASGVINRRLSSGTGSWAKAPWRVDGQAAVVLGIVFVLFGVYLVFLLIRNRRS